MRCGIYLDIIIFIKQKQFTHRSNFVHERPSMCPTVCTWKEFQFFLTNGVNSIQKKLIINWSIKTKYLKLNSITQRATHGQETKFLEIEMDTSHS